MKTSHVPLVVAVAGWLGAAGFLPAQTLLNIDFGVGVASPKTGPAAVGLSTNDFWNLYRHYWPRYSPDMPLVSDGKMEGLKWSDGTPCPAWLQVSNAPGVWANVTGDPMYDSYVFAQNGSNVVVTLHGLAPGRYYFYLYGHASADVAGEQNSIFTLRAGTNVFGPVMPSGGSTWRHTNAWIEGAQYVVFRDVPVGEQPVVIEAAPGPNGVAVLNGLQVITRGTSPPRLPSLAATRVEAPTNPPPFSTNLVIREIHYQGTLSDQEARFLVKFEAETAATNEVAAPLFAGEVAVLDPKLPAGLRIVSSGRQSQLVASAPGTYPVTLELMARVTRKEPWNEVSFVGPAAAVAPVELRAAGRGVEIQWQAGPASPGAASDTNGPSTLRAYVGADRRVALRWQSRTAETTRRALATVDTAASVGISPTVVKFSTTLNYEVLQGALPRISLLLPASQALTRLQGEQIRDWQTRSEGPRQVLTVEFIKPVEKAVSVTVFSEQTVEGTPADITLAPPEPLEVERESGTLTLNAEETLVEIGNAEGLRQVNAPAGTIAAYRFNRRPVSLSARLRRVEPVVRVTDRVTVLLEETRLVVNHGLNLTVEKAGIYALELIPPPGLVVAAVRGEGVDDWKMAGDRLKIGFRSRVLGARRLDVQLEQGHAKFPAQVVVLPLNLAGVTNAASQIGVAAAPGIQVKTAGLAGLRETPVSALSERREELLAYASDQTDWRLELATERQAARVVAEVFNLVTIGDGLVGGSATIRYGIFNQGVQEFRLRLPAHWRNVEFTGANIRRKEQRTNFWAIGLQDKVWGAYTLVVTYDYQFDPRGADLDLAGAHSVEAERETGSLGIMTAASLKLTPVPPTGSLRRVDENELSDTDRALCSRPLLLAYKYSTPDYTHAVRVTRYEEAPVLEAVADRAEMITVINEEGQMLTQASFMVKNNEKQAQQFRLPAGAEFWSSFVNGQPAKPERNGDWLLVPLPREANRDQAVAVDIVYAQKVALRTSLLPRRIEVAAPVTDIPNTYAEWQVFVPETQRLSGYGGNMTVAAGTTYEWRDAWREFVRFYGDLVEHHLGTLAVFTGLAMLGLLVLAATRRGLRGVLTTLLVVAVLAVLAGMMLPALARAKARAVQVNAMSNLKQIGLAASLWARDNGGILPPSFEAMREELASGKVLVDPVTRQPFIYAGAGKRADDANAIVAYSPSDTGGRQVVFADGSVQRMTAEKFEEALRRDAEVPRVAISGAVGTGVSTPAAPPASATSEPARPAGALPLSTTPAPVGARATATGVRPIRIDVPRAGQAFHFTKVLNDGEKPLTIQFSILRTKVYRHYMMVAQVCAFLCGLGLLWRPPRRWLGTNFWMAGGVCLVLGSLASLLLLWRWLGAALIAAVPLVLAGLLGWLIARLWRRHRAAPPSTGSAPPVANAPAAGAALLLAVALGLEARGQPAGAAGVARAAEPSTGAVLAPAVFTGAVYQGVVQDKTALLEARLGVASVGTNLFLPLFHEDIAVREFAPAEGVRLVRDGNIVGVVLAHPGQYTLDFKLAAGVGGDVTRRELSLRVPSALASRIVLNIDEGEAEVECPAAVSWRRTAGPRQTTVEAVFGAVDRLELSWTPRVKRAAEIAATVFAQHTCLVTLGNGAANARSILDYQVSQGEMRQVRLALPPGCRVLRVEGEVIRGWEIRPANEAERGQPSDEECLVVELARGVAPAYRLVVETERLLERLPTAAGLRIPRALDVKRETGLVGLRAGEEVALTVQEASDLQRVDTEEFQRNLPELSGGVASAFRFLKPGFGLTVRVESVEPEVEAVVHSHSTISAERVTLNATVDYLIKGAGVFSLRLGLPEGYRLDRLSGTNVLRHVEKEDGHARLVEVWMKDRLLGPCRLQITLSRGHEPFPGTVSVQGVHPLGTIKLSGIVTVTTEPGLAARTRAFAGLTEVPFAASGAPAGGGSALAYKFIAPQPDAEPSWRLNVDLETVEPWVRAETATVATVNEGLVSGRTVLRYEVANAPVKEFRLRVPPALRNVEVTGPQIRRQDETNREWRVELQSKVRGEYYLTVTWELPRSGQTNLVRVPGIQALGVERETGYFSVVARPPLQVADLGGVELLTRMDLQDWPSWMGRPDPATVLAWRYLRPGYEVAIEARRFAEAEVLQALIDGLRMTTVVADDGQMMTEIAMQVRNNGRQHLEMELPGDGRVWSVFVSGEPVRPTRRGTRLLLPLQREVASDAPVPVEVTYVGHGVFPRHRGTLGLESPRFDAPIKNARWEVYLPPDFEYDAFAGSMTRASDAPAPVEQVYSLAEYQGQQKAAQEQNRAEVLHELNLARENLKGGNLRQAVSSFNRSRARGQQLGRELGESRDLSQIESEVRRAQVSNLMVAQNAFYFDNSARFNGGVAPAAQSPHRPQLETQQRAAPQGAPEFDNDVAGRQWDKLQKAQQVAVAKIAPLRVNLPTRGVRYVFAQVLQTEPDKPLTVRFQAENTKRPAWGARFLAGVAGFGLLWAVLGIARRGQRPVGAA